MTAEIKRLTDELTGNILYPQTTTEAVYDTSNNRLDHILANKLSAAPSDNKQYVQKNGQWAEIQLDYDTFLQLFANTFVLRDSGNFIDAPTGSCKCKVYRYTPGQTWDQWINSSHNVDGFYFDGDLIACDNFMGEGWRRIKGSDTSMLSKKVIHNTFDLYTGGPS